VCKSTVLYFDVLYNKKQKQTNTEEHQLEYWLTFSGKKNSVSDPYSSYPDADQARKTNVDPDLAFIWKQIPIKVNKLPIFPNIKSCFYSNAVSVKAL
jgi:hypothetical protein